MNPNYLSVKIVVNSRILSNPKDPLKTVHVKKKKKKNSTCKGQV